MTEIASRYGSALFSIAVDRKQVNELQLEAKELRKVLLENRDFIVLLGNSFLSVEERDQIVDKTIKAFDEDIVSLIKVLIKNGRANQIIDVLDAFNSYCNNARGVEEGLVYSVVPLDELTLKKLQNKISQLEKVEVELINKIDPSIIGGLKVVIRGHIYDGSIKNKLENMKIDLLKKEGLTYED